jgi:hypothetical protein
MHHFAIASKGGINSVLGVNPVTVFGNDCKLWINTASPENKSLSGPFQCEVPSLISDDNNHYLFASPISTVPGSEVHRNVANKGLHILPGKFWTQGSSSNWNLIHNGSSWTMVFRYRPLYTSSTHNNPIISNNNNTTANIGFAVYYDNRSSQSRTHALVCFISKGVGGQSILLVVNNFFTTSDYVTCRIAYNSATGDLTAHKNGTLVGTQNKGAFTHVVTNATASLVMFRQTQVATYSDAALMKHPIIINRTVTTPEATTLDFIVEQGSENFGQDKPANLYFGWGQSNWDGTAESVSPVTSLRELMPGVLMWAYTGRDNIQINAGQGFDFVKWRTNPNDGVSNEPRFGPWLSIAEKFNVANPGNTFIGNYAVGATALQDGVTSPDWNVASGATECAQQATNEIIYCLDMMKYTFDRDPVVRGLMGREGETDGLAPVTTFKADATALFKKFIDAIETSGYSTSLMRIVINYVHRTDYASPTRPYTADIDAAWDDLAANWATDNPTYASKVKGFHFVTTDDLPLGSDDTHLTSASQRTAGWRNFDELEPYMAET